MKKCVAKRLMQRMDFIPPDPPPKKNLRRKTRRFEERLLEKIEFGPGCWEWTGAKTPAGYGRLGYGVSKSGYVYAHREMYRLWYWAELPKGNDRHVMHSCDNPGCVRPDHLSLGTAKQNHDDAVARGRK